MSKLLLMACCPPSRSSLAESVGQCVKAHNGQLAIGPNRTECFARETMGQPTLPINLMLIKQISGLCLLFPAPRFLGPVLRGTAGAGQVAPLPARGFNRGAVIAVEKHTDTLQGLNLASGYPGPVHR